MGSGITRATIIWFVGAALLSAVSSVLHVLRSEIGGADTSMPLAIGAYATTALAALMLYRGIMVAADEVDAADRAPRHRERLARSPVIPVQEAKVSTGPGSRRQ